MSYDLSIQLSIIPPFHDQQKINKMIDYFFRGKLFGYQYIDPFHFLFQYIIFNHMTSNTCVIFLSKVVAPYEDKVYRWGWNFLHKFEGQSTKIFFVIKGTISKNWLCFSVFYLPYLFHMVLVYSFTCSYIWLINELLRLINKNSFGLIFQKLKAKSFFTSMNECWRKYEFE